MVDSDESTMSSSVDVDEACNTTAEIIDSIAQDLAESPHTPPPKRRRLYRTTPTTSTLRKEAMLGAAFERMSKEDDECDKTALLLAEHMRNTVAEFPLLADEFRTQLLQSMLDVQSRRSNQRMQGAIFINVPGKNNL